MMRRVEPTPGSTTHTNTAEDGKCGALAARKNAACDTAKGSTLCEMSSSGAPGASRARAARNCPA